MQKTTLVVKERQDERKRQQLRSSIERKREILKQLTVKIELLEMDLTFIQHEYNVRIGRIILKDNQLDLEIIRCKNILALMQEGYAYAQAVREINKKYYTEEKTFQHEQEQIDLEQKLVDKYEKTDETLRQTLKELWKKILFKFHPDLVAEKEEKQRREEIMKRVNKAYAEQDIKTLKAIESEEIVTADGKESTENLEQILVAIENAIIQRRTEYQSLRKSEWYGWKKSFDKAKKKKQDIFLELEKKLLDSIVQKIDLLNNLKAQLEQKEFL